MLACSDPCYVICMQTICQCVCLSVGLSRLLANLSWWHNFCWTLLLRELTIIIAICMYCSAIIVLLSPNVLYQPCMALLSVLLLVLDTWYMSYIFNWINSTPRLLNFCNGLVQFWIWSSPFSDFGMLKIKKRISDNWYSISGLWKAT